jgi:hypothetical protein
MKIQKDLSKNTFRLFVLLVFMFANSKGLQAQISQLITTQNAYDSAIVIITSRNQEDGSSQTGLSLEQDIEINRQGHLYKDGTSFLNYRVNCKINIVNILYNSRESLLEKYINNSNNTLQVGYLRRFKGNWDKKKFADEDMRNIVEQNGIKDTGYNRLYPVSLLRIVKKSWLQVIARGSHQGYYYYQDSAIHNQSNFNWSAEISLNQYFKNIKKGINLPFLKIHHITFQYKVGLGYSFLRDYYPLIKTDVYLSGIEKLKGDLSKVNYLIVAKNQKPQIRKYFFYLPINLTLYFNNKKDNGLGIGLQAQINSSKFRYSSDFAPYLLIPFNHKRRNMTIIAKMNFIDISDNVYRSKSGLSNLPIYTISFNTLNK